jgi:hypothetical protein
MGFAPRRTQKTALPDRMIVSCAGGHPDSGAIEATRGLAVSWDASVEQVTGQGAKAAKGMGGGVGWRA